MDPELKAEKVVEDVQGWRSSHINPFCEKMQHPNRKLIASVIAGACDINWVPNKDAATQTCVDQLGPSLILSTHHPTVTISNIMRHLIPTVEMQPKTLPFAP